MIEKFRSLVRREKAFTLVELLIVIAIIAILTVAFLPGALRAPAKARDAQSIKTVNDIAAAVEAYMTDRNGVLPAGASPYCISNNSGVGVSADLVLLATYFPGNTFPVAPRVVGDGSCNSPSPSNRSYFYRNYGNTNYVVGARVELQLSTNTTATIGSGVNIAGAGTLFNNIQPLTANSAGGTGGSSVIATSTTDPFLFLRLGP